MIICVYNLTIIEYGKGQVVLVLNQLSTTQRKNIREWMY
jgi:hypothetical protein